MTARIEVNYVDDPLEVTVTIEHPLSEALGGIARDVISDLLRHLPREGDQP